ncbi:hypothetical protein KW794_01985 [Candidatus Saccharibacteria bacterium]|nr:hypothetical protein [Candidatus Saccharibacteria bacterium]
MPAKNQSKLSSTQILLLVAAVAVYGYIAKLVLDSVDPWNSLGTLGVVFLVPLAVALPVAFLALWIFMFLEALKNKQYLWAIAMFLFPVLSIFYWLQVSSSKPR